MAVEIHILSGVRQGERLAFNGDSFKAGDRPTCEILFDSTRDLGAKDKFAAFQRQEDGWTVRGEGPDMLINVDPLTSLRRIRSGDVIRMSPIGPDLSFHLVSRATAAENHRPSTIDPTFPSSEPIALPNNSPAYFRGPSHARTRGSWIRWSGVAIAIVLVVFLGVWLMLRDRASSTVTTVNPPDRSLPVENNPPPPAREKAKENAPAAESDGDRNGAGKVIEQETEKASASDPRKNEEKAASQPPTEQKEPDPVEQLRDAVFLIEIEDPKSHSVWPFATCVAVSENTALTTATVGCELAKMIAENWRVSIVSATSGFKEPLAEVRIHRAFRDLREEPEKRIYFDLAVLTVRQEFRKIAPLASSAELDELGSGAPLVCIGIAHEGEIINRFQSIAPESFRGKVLIVTSLPPSPGPRLLHMKMTIGRHMYGSPFLNSQGRAVALYAEAAALPQQGPSDQAQTNLSLHYAPVLDRESLEAWTRDRNADFWVEPDVSKTLTTAPKTP
jgi:hypothetical protein